MALLDIVWIGRSVTAEALKRICRPLAKVSLYAGLFIALDWISFVYVLPSVSFTLWNPPPACSLALLLIEGLRYAPWLLVVSFVSDGLVAGYPAGLGPTFMADAMVAAGYTAVAVVLRRLCHPERGFGSAANVAIFLLIVGVGVSMVAGLATATFVLAHVLTPSEAIPAIRHFWIGDFTGIIGLLPGFLALPLAYRHWSQLTPSQRFVEITTFVVGAAFALFIVFGLIGDRQLHYFYLLLLPIIWIAVRHGLPWSAIAVTILQTGTIATVTALGYPSSEFLALQLLLITIAGTGLVIGGVVTERQSAEENLQRQQAELNRVTRLTTAGALGMAVVHQISQPLATIGTYIHASRELLRAGPAKGDLLAKTLAKTEAEVLRAGAIVDRLRDFVSNGNRHLCLTDLGAVARQLVVALIDDARRHAIDIHVDAASTMPVMVDRIQIEQVLVNLIRNAIDAMSGLDGERRQVRVILCNVGHEVEVAVEDDGPGISRELAEDLFEPFESTKRGGMGLGLWLSKELVLGHGGRLWWEPNAAGGARFLFRLPRADANVAG
jgi:signal transduction histidine kinase